MQNLNPDSVELVSSPRPVPLNGSPVSADFNLFQTEVLADLAELADFVNESLLPILQGLASTAATGLDGSGLYADRTKDDPLFRDSDGNLETVSGALGALKTQQTSLVQQISDLSARVLSLQTRLSTTSQNDLRATVQSLQNSYTTLYNRISGLLGDVALQGSSLSKIRKMAVDIPAQAAGSHTIDVLFDPSFADNSFVATLGIETAGGLTISGFTKKAAGAGLEVRILADGTNPTGVLHVLANSL